VRHGTVRGWFFGMWTFLNDWEIALINFARGGDLLTVEWGAGWRGLLLQ